jgi:hypothetical protein
VSAGTNERSRPAFHRRWWIEVLLVAAFDVVYELTSELLSGERQLAIHHGEEQLSWESAVGLDFEHSLQKAFLSWRWIIQAANDYYATVHFVAPVVVLLWLFFKEPERYHLWRDALAWTTAIAFLIFLLFPMAPPRMLPLHYGFVDTMATYGGAGRFDTTLLAEAGNQFAAFPSLHISWATWSAAAITPVLPRTWMRVVVWIDPVLTAFVVLVTGNHYVFDLLGGLAVLGLGMALARRRVLRWPRRQGAQRGSSLSDSEFMQYRSPVG